MRWFTSARERRLWSWVTAVLVAIYSTVPLAGAWAAQLDGQDLLGAAFAVAFALVIIAIVWGGLRQPDGSREIWVGLGVISVFGMIAVRMGVSAAERSHLFEYGLLAVLVYEALLERRRARTGTLDGPQAGPALAAIVTIALLGWLDEGIQALVPGRVYDLRDVGVNALAGFMGVAARMAIRGTRVAAQRRAARASGASRQ